MNDVLLIIFVLAGTIRVDGRKLYEFLAVTKVDGLPPAPSWSTRPKERMCQLGVGFRNFVQDLTIRFQKLDFSYLQ